jgi:predicted PurR-regulated permease PerM
VTPRHPPTSIVDGMPEPQVGRVLPLWLTVILGAAGTAVAVWGLSAGAPILGPVFLAFVLVVVVHPMIGALERRGVRRALAVAAAVVVVEGVLLGFAVALFLSFGQLATVLPEYSDEWQALLDDVRSTLAAAGIGRDQVEDVLSSVDFQSALSAVGGLLAAVAGAVAALVLVIATVLFMTAEGAGLPGRLAPVPGSRRLRAALHDFARNTRRYLVVTTIFGFLVAVVDTVALIIIGIPLPFLWGLLSFLTNYVPNIGFFLGLAPPTLLALLVGGPGTALIVIAVYSLANFVIQSVIQPVFVGDAVGLSVTLSFLSVIVWTVILGPLGAVLAIPLTLFAHAILVGHDPERRWARTLLAGTSGAAAEVPHERRRRGRRSRRADRDAAPAEPETTPSSAEDDAAAPVPREPDDARPGTPVQHLAREAPPPAGGSP